MGRVFLVAIVVGLLWGGYKVYQSITGLTDGEKLAHRYEKADRVREKPVEPKMPEDSPPVPPAPPAAPHKEPLAVLAACSEFLLVEAWGIVRSGDQLPDGSSLLSWTSRDAVVTQPDGSPGRLRFRRPAEAMAEFERSLSDGSRPAAFASLTGAEEQSKKRAP
ncbi:MAG: hypothetical protein FGM15_12395 [Chthoniobacterales bacterium]|nr:hypothetical protein [Chthoniobacterales bacterium]